MHWYKIEMKINEFLLNPNNEVYFTESGKKTQCNFFFIFGLFPLDKTMSDFFSIACHLLTS